MVDFNSDAELRSKIRELEQALEAERKEHFRLCAALFNASVGHFAWNFERHEVYVSPLLQEMLGHGEENPMPTDPMTWLTYVHEEDRFRIQADIREALMYGRTRFEGTYRIVRLNGQVRLFLFRARITRRERVEGGDASHALGAAIDVTSR